jgi:hypothetical protein
MEFGGHDDGGVVDHIEFDEANNQVVELGFEDA